MDAGGLAGRELRLCSDRRMRWGGRSLSFGSSEKKISAERQSVAGKVVGGNS